MKKIFINIFLINFIVLFAMDNAISDEENAALRQNKLLLWRVYKTQEILSSKDKNVSLEKFKAAKQAWDFAEYLSLQNKYNALTANDAGTLKEKMLKFKFSIAEKYIKNTNNFNQEVYKKLMDEFDKEAAKLTFTDFEIEFNKLQSLYGKKTNNLVLKEVGTGALKIGADAALALGHCSVF